MILCLEKLNKIMVESPENEVANPFGQWLRKKREAKGWSVRFLATLTNGACSGSFISQLENNTYAGKKGKPMQPDRDIVDALAGALGESVTIARKLADYATEDFEEPALLDSELEVLFHSSKNWSEENRKDAYDLAKSIFRKYQDKERARLRQEIKETASEIIQDRYIEEIDRSLEEYHDRKRRGEKIMPDVEIETVSPEEIIEPKLEFKDGKIQEKKASRQKPKGDK